MLATPELIQETAQSFRLADVLPRWLSEIPLYRGHGAAPEADGPDVVLKALRRRPFITKQDIRRGFPHNFLGENADLEQYLEDDVIELEHTSGTSEERTALLLPNGWWAEQEQRALLLNPVTATACTPGARRVTISSPVCSGDICYTGVPARSERIIGNALFVSLSRHPFLWTEAELARMAAETLEWQPLFLDVDPVYGVAFALYCEKHGLRFPSLKFILASYEFVSVNHRRVLERVFGVPVFNLYGSTETGHLMMEDESGLMRPSLETAFLELLEPESAEPTELVVTTLSNPIMPLIRYRIGDLVERRPHPIGTRYIVHGRAADACRTPSGRRVTVWQVDQCFAPIPGIAHYQLIERPGAWLLRFVPDSQGPADAGLRDLGAPLGELLELEQPIEFKPADMLLPEKSGKFRLIYPLANTAR